MFLVFSSIYLMQNVSNFLSDDEDGTIEKEIRFGTFKGNFFEPGIESKKFYRVLDYFMDRLKGIYIAVPDPLYSKSNINFDINKLIPIHQASFKYKDYNLRESWIGNTKSPRFYSLKSNIGQINIYEYNARLNKAKETEITENKFNEILKEKAKELKTTFDKIEPDNYRIKHRWSFAPDIKKGQIIDNPFMYFRIDLTHVTGWTKETVGPPDQRTINKKPVNTFEIELELIANPNDYKKSNIGIDKIILKAILEITKLIQDSNYPMTSQEIYSLITEFNNYFKPEIRKLEEKKSRQANRPWTFSKFKFFNPLNKPVNVKINNLINEKDLWVTDKADGSRKLLYINQKAGYLIYPPNDISKFLVNGKDVRETQLLVYSGGTNSSSILDGELVVTNNGNKEFLVFDILYDRGENLMELPFEERFLHLRKLLENSFPIKLKTFFNQSSIPNRIKNTIKTIPNKNWSNDGLILNKSNANYSSNFSVFKWKPSDKMSIDFYIKSSDVPGKFVLYVKDGNKLVAFEGTDKFPVLPIYLGPIKLEPDQIGEFRYVNEKWIFDRYRRDRDEPNNKSTALSVWQDINKPLELETITGTNLILMRKYHNDIKRDMYKNIVTNKIIDIGSGRFGDLNKITNKTIYAIEPNKSNIEKGIERLLDQNFKKIGENKYTKNDTQIISINLFGQDPKLPLLVGKSDAIVAFNSLTFFFKSENDLNSLLINIDKILSKNGLFIGIVMDADKLLTMLDPEYKLRYKLSKTQDYFDIDNYLFRQEPLTFTNKEFKLTSDSNNEKITELVNKLKIKPKNEIITESWKILLNKFNLSNNFGNEILIDLYDSDAIVKNQVEWLVNFDFLTEKLSTIGLELIETKFLDNNINLSESQNELSSLYRTFIFKKTGTDTIQGEINLPQSPLETSLQLIPSTSLFYSIKPNFLNTDETSPFNKFLRIGVIDGKLLHSILYGIIPNYSKLSINNRLNVYKKIKNYLKGKKVNLTVESLAKFLKLNISLYTNYDVKRFNFGEKETINIYENLGVYDYLK